MEIFFGLGAVCFVLSTILLVRGAYSETNKVWKTAYIGAGCWSAALVLTTLGFFIVLGGK